MTTALNLPETASSLYQDSSICIYDTETWHMEYQQSHFDRSLKGFQWALGSVLESKKYLAEIEFGWANINRTVFLSTFLNYPTLNLGEEIAAYLLYRRKSDTVGDLGVDASVFGVNKNFEFNVGIVELTQTTSVGGRELLSYQGNIEAIQVINDLEKLESNWDQDGALAPDSETISRARQQVVDLDALGYTVFDVYPGYNGDIVITLKNADKEVDIILYPSKFKSQLVRTSDTEPGKQVGFSGENLKLFLNWLTKENDPSGKRTESIVK